MEEISRGFLIKKKGKIKINHKKTNSILLNKLQVDLLLKTRRYMRGYLLDAGCGEKPYSLIYDELVEKSIGCDVEHCIHDQSSVDVYATLDKLPFENDTFDTILCTNVLEHVAENVKSFSELSRVLKSNGCIIAIIPFLYPLHEQPYDFYRYTVYGLKHLMKQNGLNILHIVPLGGAGMMFFVYFNLFLCKFLNCRILSSFGCILQEIEYAIYKRMCFKRLLKNGIEKGIAKIISTGYFIVAKKEN